MKKIMNDKEMPIKKASHGEMKKMKAKEMKKRIEKMKKDCM